MLGGLEQTRNLLLQQQIGLNRQLREIDRLMPKKRTDNDYSIIKQARKKEGFVYCAKYYVFGKLLPTKYSLKTTDLETAQKRAIAWKERLLNSYKKGANMGCAFHNLLSGYYADDSVLLQESLNTRRQISKDLIKRYNNFINKLFIPFLKEEGILTVENLKPEKILKFGGWLRDIKLLTAKTINDRINGAIKQALDFLYLKERIQYNPFRHIEKGDITIKAKKGEVKKRRIFPVNRLFDVLFDNKMWVLVKSKESLKNPADKKIKMKRWLLCLIAATTGLREAEIFMLRKSCIEKIGGIYFLNIDNSRVDLENKGVKTENAYRRVPLHKFVYGAINDYIKKENITSDYIFFTGNRKTVNAAIFAEAYKQCGIHCGYTESETKENNIDFHSFRHFYQSILSQGGLSKVLITYFMGHAKNMNDMGERYNNIEEIGNDIGDIELLVDNAKRVIKTLDYHLNNAYTRHIEENEKQTVYIEPKEVILTNRKMSKIKYWTYVISGYENFIDSNEE
jgi:integrase